MRLKDKVAFITGAARGIGEATAKIFVMEGAKVILTDVLEEGRKVEEQLNRESFRSIFIRGDMSKNADVNKAVSVGVGRFGPINIVVNNAGIMHSKVIQDGTEEDWNYVIDNNLKSQWLVVKRVLPEMIKAGGGSIVNVSSIGGVVGFMNFSIYGASKGGIVGMTREMALELSNYNIRVNCMCPGAIDTPMPVKALEGFENKEEAWKSFTARQLMNRFGKPEEAAYPILFLASDEASFITGVTLPVDGGWTCW